MAEGNSSLEHTPTWAIATVCFCFIAISLILEATFYCLTQFLRKRKRKALVRAFEKTETEMMTMGFVSLLLTITEVPISKICVREAVANSFHPCNDVGSQDHEAAVWPAGYSTDTAGDSYCQAKGLVSLLSREGVVEIRMFIFVLAVFHVIYCILTMLLGMAKMRRWEAWEEETRSLEYQIANDPRRFRYIRQTSFGRRHLKMWSEQTLLLWPVCFVRQFSGSASKADYFTLRNGFILANVAQGSDFNFQKFLARAFDDDFEQVVGIRLWIWMFCLLFIIFSAQGFYNYYWLPFIPLVVLLVVGTKLETIITKMCKKRSKNSPVILGSFSVTPSDEYFWFNRPKLLLYLLQLVLIQNSFQLAFFTWAWYEYGLRSCFNRETEDIAIRITAGMVVQFLCGYVTLPIYALVTQMGSSMKKAVFTERVTKGLKNWHCKATQNLSKTIKTSTPETREPAGHKNKYTCSAARARPVTSTPEITEEEATSSTIFTTDDDTNNNNNDGEISFARSWKNMEISRASTSGDIISSSIIDDDDFGKHSK